MRTTATRFPGIYNLWFFIPALVLFEFLDWLTTTLILRAGGYEMNPLFTAVAVNPVLMLVVKLLICGCAALCAYEGMKLDQKDRVWPAAAMCILVGACAALPVINNSIVLLS